MIAPSTLATHHDELGTFADGLVGRSDVIARSMLAECHAELGTFADGLVLGEEGLSIAEAAAHPVSCLFALQGISSSLAGVTWPKRYYCSKGRCGSVGR